MSAYLFLRDIRPCKLLPIAGLWQHRKCIRNERVLWSSGIALANELSDIISQACDHSLCSTYAGSFTYKRVLVGRT
jgi:hypothetical protein